MAGLTAGVADLVGALGAAGSVTQSVHIVGPDGQEIPASAVQGEDISGLVHAMMSGDPAARQAAMARIRQIREQLGQRAAADAGYSAPGSTFDPIGPAGGMEAFSGPVTGAASGQSAAPASFTQFSPPSQDSQVNLPAWFGAPSAFDPFSGGAGQGTVEERMTKLRQLYDKGILTESEYQAKRQQIIDGI